MVTRPVRNARRRAAALRVGGTQIGRKGEARGLTDAAIRFALRACVLKQHSRAPDSVVLEELGLCRGFARVDLAVVNGLLHGYEIKSDRDSLRRLATQVEAYGRVFDRLTLVVGDRHCADAAKSVPRWWGVMRVRSDSAGPRFQMLRHAKRNPHRDARALVELLWADQALALLEARGADRGVRGKPRRFLWERIAQEMQLAEIAVAVREHLKARGAKPSPR
jgi:hypothetical protein